jgi:hypothetical protein
MGEYIFGSDALRNAAKLRPYQRHRVSSYDRTGGNADWVIISPGEKKILFDVDGPGCITHIWTTQITFGAKFWPRNLIFRIWWDNESEPSVECPLSDFFGCGHGERHTFSSLPLQMSPRDGSGFNCWWPMPFKSHARIELENDNPNSYTFDLPFKKTPGVNVYYYVDYETYNTFPEDPESPLGYFHAQFRRMDFQKDMIRDPDTGRKFGRLEWQSGGKNTRANGGYDRNYVILDATGEGQYVGCNLNIDNRPRLTFNWPGEGDDMIFIDDDIGGEPTLYGTGTEDYVNQAFSPQETYNSLYHGTIKGGGLNWNGKITYYRYHIQDPIRFRKAIKVTIEHGHNNSRGDRWESTAYWYQLEPHQNFPILPDRKARMPRVESHWKLWCTLGVVILLGIFIWQFFFK